MGSRSEGTIYTEYFNPGSTPKYEEFLPQHQGRKRGQMQALILDGYKGLRYDVKSADDDFEIYDLANDPQEGNNLAGTGKFVALQAKMKARVLQMRRPSDNAPRPYDEALVPALATEPKGESGLAWARYEGSWPWMPDFRFMSAAATGSTTKVGQAMPEGAGKSFGVAYTGFVKVPADGTYTISVASENMVTLFLHDARVVDEPMRGASKDVSATVNLAAGWHPVRLYYRNQAGKPGFEISVRNAEDQVIDFGPDSLRH